MLFRSRVAHVADTTVVDANVRYPTDSGLLATAVVKIARLVGRIKAAAGATRTPCRDRSRAANRRARQVIQTLRRRGNRATEQVQAAVAGLTRQLANLAEQATAEAGPDTI